MSRWWWCLRTAVRQAVLEQARNRAALVPTVLIVPLWLWLAHLVLPADPVLFPLRPTGRPVLLDADVVAQLSGALHSLTLVVGFMMFLSTGRSAVFYGRLARAGCPRGCLVPAQGAVLLLWAVSTAGYATAWVCVFGRPERIDVLAAALCVGALGYGAVGILLASVTRSEPWGLFLVTTVGFVDLTLQNPVASPFADAPAVRLLPAYGAMQAAVSAVAGGGTPWRHLLLGLCWAAALSLAGLVAHGVRTAGRKGSSAGPRRGLDGVPERSLRGGARERAFGGVPGQARAVSPPPPAPPPVVRRPRPGPGPGRVYRLAGITDPEVRAGYETCRRLVRRSSRLDRAIVRLLPAGLRPLLWAVYGYGRTVDDLADAPDDTARRRTERVGAYSRALETDLRRGRSADPVRAALVDAVWRWELPGDGLSAMAAGHRTDEARETRLLTWEDWHAYWDRLSFPFGVSRLLGLLSGPGLSFTERDADALRRWSDAYHLLDALRSLREDARQGSVKLPHDVLDEFGVTADDLRQPQRSERVTALVRALADRADAWLTEAAHLGGQHPPAAALWRTVVTLQRLELARLRHRPRRVPFPPAGPAADLRFHCLLLAGRLRVAHAWRRARTAAVTLPAPPLP
uniref:phytoene/squalene synthase family protein n=1 Tax=Streptomyces sp. CRN 30 TaxID=3075613 RepID=UPI002A81849B